MRTGGRETAVLRKILTAGLLMMIAAGRADAAEIRALISNGLHTTVAELAPQFEAATGHKLSLRYDTAAFLQRDIERGVDFDVTVITGTNFDAVAKAGKFDLATRTEVVRSGIGVAVRQGAPKPDISTVEAFKRSMLNAKSIAYATVGTSGVHFMAVCERLGIAQEVKAKGKTLPGGMLAEFVVKGEAELAIQQVSELLAVAGVEVIGPFPPELQLTTRYTAGVAASTANADAGKAFIRFLTTPQAQSVMKAKGLDPG
jgi:molybdate transport system substrate-binding protein